MCRAAPHNALWPELAKLFGWRCAAASNGFAPTQRIRESAHLSHRRVAAPSHLGTLHTLDMIRFLTNWIRQRQLRRQVEREAAAPQQLRHARAKELAVLTFKNLFPQRRPWP